MIIKKYFKQFNIGYKNINKIFNKYGLLFNKNYNNVNINLSDLLEKCIILTIIKKEILFKNIYENLLFKLENGSYKGYKKFRGLPIKGQRTKTNSRTARKS
jgi:small subunit ribosomal protein S13